MKARVLKMSIERSSFLRRHWIIDGLGPAEICANPTFIAVDDESLTTHYLR
jgi:hypothetical protein